ncbi:hypothetical protein Tco_1146592 [Tanacetum coccineum]
MHPLAPHYKRKTRVDRGKKRPHETNASSSSTTYNPPSSSLLIDAMIDENDDESFYSNSLSPSRHVSSSSNVGSRRIIHNGWLEWKAKAAKDGIMVKTGNSRVNAAGHYLVLLGES